MSLSDFSAPPQSDQEAAAKRVSLLFPPSDEEAAKRGSVLLEGAETARTRSLKMKEKEAKFQEQRRRSDEDEDNKAKAAALLGAHKLPGLGSPTMKPKSGDGKISGDDQDEWTEEEEEEEELQTSLGQRDAEREAFTDEEGDETPVERIETFVTDAAEVDTEGTRHSKNQQGEEGKNC